MRQQGLFCIKSESKAAAPDYRINRRELNPAQFEAATSLDGPVLVIAGAGSGKTRTLVYRLAQLIGQGIPPERILLLTFTRKAAQEMLHRASLLLDASCRRVTGGTFHATANLLLRRYAHLLGYQANFTIIDQSDAEGIVNLLKASLDLGKKDRRFPSRRLVLGILSKAINKGSTVEEILESEYSHLNDFLDDILLIGKHYQQFKLEHGLMDYDDLLVNWQKVLSDFPEARETLAGRFSHIMVDEYQDTNPIQADIVRLMASRHGNVMAVGDDSQSIYSFRGADFRNIMEFPNLFPNTRLIRLEENYRSTQRILDLTNAIIANAQEKYSKTLFTRIEGGDRPVLHGAMDESDQAAFVATRIVELLASGEKPDEIAILFRSSHHSYKLELELAHRKVEFEKRGGLKLTETAHIKDVISYLRVVVNPHDRLSWNRLLLQIDKIGPKTAKNILDRMQDATDPFVALAKFPARGKIWQKGFAELVALFASFRNVRMELHSMFDRIMDYYWPIFERLYPDDYPKRKRDLEQLQAIIAGYDKPDDAETGNGESDKRPSPMERLQSFLDDASLDPPQAVEEQNQGRLILSTIHSAKGLEWETVFIINLADGKFPAAQAHLPEQQEEERRLLYVAATRAKKRLFLVYPRETAQANSYAASRGGISPFLAELPPGLTQGSGGIHYAGRRVGSLLAGRPQVRQGKVKVESRMTGPGRLVAAGLAAAGRREAREAADTSEAGRMPAENEPQPGGSAPPKAATCTTLTLSWQVRVPAPPAASKPAKRTAAPNELLPGVRVRHPFFGEGHIDSSAGPRSLVVHFLRYGKRTIHLDYAKLELLT